ncbi:hypothetical protein [Ramlibacter sp. AN1133]|uniref:hypothetical protein n=1 Tax=Ramlibacter sp. AN1133 TaxID=3133429 RepID=UPI0030BB7838
MQTPTDSLAPRANWLDPFGSWEAAGRWNAIFSEWMTQGWQQWLELVTVWPALEAPAAAKAASPAQAGTQEARNTHSVRAQAPESRRRADDATSSPTRASREARPDAKAASKRLVRKRPARPEAGARRPRTRG